MSPRGILAHGVIFMEIQKHPQHQNHHQMKAHKIKNVAVTLKNMNKGEIPSDVLGSYTGITRDNELPVQDADDL